MKLLEQIQPTHIVRNIEGITPEALHNHGLGTHAIKAIAFDVDGTLMEHHAKEVEETVEARLLELGEAGYRLYIISNAYNGRVDELRTMFEESNLGMRVLSPASVTPEGLNPKDFRKPKPYMLLDVVEEVGGPVAMVGDQIYKDILSANRADMPSVLLPRRGSGDDPRVKYLQRPAETVIRLPLKLPLTANGYPEILTAA